VSLLRENTNTGTRRLISLNSRVSVLAGKKGSWVAALAALPFFVALNLCTAQTLSQSPSQGPSPSSFAPFAGAVISEWKGSVQVQLPGGAAGRPVRGQNLPEGTALDTQDGRLVLVLRADESEIVVQPHTRLILLAPQPGNWDALQIILGKVRAYIRKRTGGAPPFQMGTPSAVIAVRGTRFDVEINANGVSEIDVFEGLVEVGSTALPGVSVLVSPGMSTRVGVGTAPETPVPTREIRPDVEVPNQMAKLEFAREKALQVERLWDVELGERPDTEVGEIVDESRESENGKH
jgi:FecR-like protein